MNIGVLALQGAFAEHAQCIAQLGAAPIELRKRAHLEGSLDGLILPGGESTVQGKLLRELDMFEPLRELIRRGTPVFGTCAGLILLAKKIENDPAVHLGLMDVAVSRNAYGRQLGSFHTTADFAGIGPVPMTFIRAPAITALGGAVTPLAEVDGITVAARQNNMLACAFHPELDADLAVHKLFLSMVAARR